MMKHYKHAVTGEIFAFEDDGSQDDYITTDMIPLTATETKKVTTRKQRVSDVWDDIAEDWVDARTLDQIEADRLAAFQPLTRRQFKLGLLDNGLIEQIDTAIAGIADPATRTRFQIEYAESPEFYRNSTTILQLMEIMGLTTEQVDAMWQQALTL